MNYEIFGLDIMMCFGDNCYLKKKCIRYLAKTEKYQSYFTEFTYQDRKYDCYDMK